MYQYNKLISIITHRFLFRTISLYFLCYIFFVSDVSNSLHLHFISIEIARLTNKWFVHRDFKGFVPVADFFWHYLASLTFFILATIAALIWTIIDKGERFTSFSKYAYVLLRYYLGIMMLSYGINKLDGLQFKILPSRLIQQVGSTNTFDLFWILMGASKTYSFFGGLLEVSAAFLLFFRRTTTLGSILAFFALLNVFLLGMSYGTGLQFFVLNLLLVCIFLLARDLDRLYKFFILRQITSLPTPVPALIENKRFHWIQLLSKYAFIGYILFSSIKPDLDLYYRITHLPYQSLVGIHSIRDFHSSNPADNLKSPGWKQMAVDPFDDIKIEWANDSCAYFSIKVDTSTKTLELNAWTDTSGKAILHYKEIKSNEWIFQGTYKTDSIRFSSTKIDMYSLPLLKGRGKIKWVYD